MADDNSVASWMLGGGGLIAFGSGLKWAWDKISNWRASREAKLEAREDEYVKKLEERLVAVEKLAEHHSGELERHRLALGILIAKECRTDPNSTELMQVRAILGASFPVHLTPTDMQASLDKLNGE